MLTVRAMWASFLVLFVAASGAAQPSQSPRGTADPPRVRPVAVPDRLGPAVTELAFKALTARSIGPGVMGGRVSDIALDPSDPFTFYVGLGTGGVMKSTDNGGTFSAIFEKQPVAAIGAVAVAPSDARIVWVGTGEANDRNSSGWGNGVYRSSDSGATWTHAGLRDSKTIARIVVHPKDANTAWVAAMGDLWNVGGERGLYKTTDGGRNWRLILQAPAPHADKTGCGDVAIDPSNPDILYAALYARRRTPWSFVAGSELTGAQDEGGIFKSTDGGATWTKLRNGLPGGMGRIGLSVHAKNPKVVYAVVQSDEGGTSAIEDVTSRRGGIFRSENGGESWERMNRLNPRPFYFSQIRVDPENERLVYVLGFALHVSEDGGRTFREDRFKNVHPDLHALAIDPRFTKRLLLGTDGGTYLSYDGGGSWAHLNNMAAGEYYRIAVDMSTPYRICGGLQDNQNWVGPSATRTKDGIVHTDWINISGGDGFYCVFDETDRDVLYAESQSGYVHRFNLRNGELKLLRPEPAEGQRAFRFHWNSPLIGSRHKKGTMYLAGNRVFALADRGENWRAISPDLSAQDPAKSATVGSGAETYGVVYTLAESPTKPGVLWAGTDDGKVWMTQDEGGNWIDRTENLPAPARGQWASRIDASHHDPSVAYLAVDAHRSGNYAPLVYRTEDGGRSWQNIAANLPADGPVKVIREDPQNAGVLYVGTEFGLFLSVNRGAHWVRFGGLPTVAIDDIHVHPRDADLVIATHGRSLYIVDDVRPVQQFTPEIAAKSAHLFPPRRAFGTNLLPGSIDWTGSAVFRGQNPPEGAILDVYVNQYTGDKLALAITNPAGQTVATLSAPGTPGINRLVWDLKPSKDVLATYGSEGQKFVRPGEYKVALSYGTTKQEETLIVEIAEGIETR